MKKRISFRLFFNVLWLGFCQIFVYIGKVFGYTDRSSLGKVIWRISATCFTALLSLFTVCIFYAFITEVVIEEWICPYKNDYTWECQKHISNHIVFQKEYWSEKTRIYNEANDSVVLENLDWVITSDDHDSLAVFAKDGKRGYLNRFTGEVVIPLRYSRAWIFSEGLAAVERDGELLFIDHNGRVIIDKDFQVHYNEPIYVFKNGYCIVKNPVDGKMGLIDYEGNWALKPEYDNIYNDEGFWQVEKDSRIGLYSSDLQLMFPITNTGIYISDNSIKVSLSDHTAKLYDYNGNIISDFVIDEISNLLYETDKLKEINDCDDDIDCNKIYGIANRQQYKVFSGDYIPYYGLIDRNGKRITPPIYTYIEAISKNRYLCQPQGLIIDDNGNIVK